MLMIKLNFNSVQYFPIRNIGFISRAICTLKSSLIFVPIFNKSKCYLKEDTSFVK